MKEKIQIFDNAVLKTTVFLLFDGINCLRLGALLT